MIVSNIRFSIGIPAFKNRYLKECINSIINQSYENFELIIVNDCSPEDIESTVSHFSDKRIRYYANDVNIGAENVVDNWNLCLSKATGDFFVLMGDDDVMAPDYLEEFVRLIEKYPNLDVFHCRAKVIDESSQPFLMTSSRPEYESVYDLMWHRIKSFRTQFISDFVYRIDPLKVVGGFYKFPLAWASDDITAYIACGKKGIAHTNKPVFYYRRSRYTISSTGSIGLKLRAADLERAWFTQFLISKPDNENDIIQYNDILRIIDRFILKKKIDTVSEAMIKSPFKELSKWFLGGSKFGLSKRNIIAAFLLANNKKR